MSQIDNWSANSHKFTVDVFEANDGSEVIPVIEQAESTENMGMRWDLTVHKGMT